MTKIDWNDMLQQTRTAIADYERAAEALRGVLLGQGFIVQCQGIPLAFAIEDGYAANPRIAQPQLATRFTREDAERVAAEVKNGNGIAGEVVHVRQAVEQSLKEQREILALLLANSDATSEQQ